MIKVLVLSHKRARENGPRLARFIFHKIYRMYSDINKKEEINAAMLLTRMSEHKEANKVNKYRKDSHDNDDNNQPILKKMTTPSDLNDIQPRTTQVWDCDKIGVDRNEIWSNIICTYMFFQSERMCKVQTGERAQFWCTLLFFTQAGGQCFMPPIIVHQAKEYSQDIRFNTLLEWIVHHTPSGYMDRDGWQKSMIQLFNMWGASPVNNHIMFFDGHDSHFEDGTLRQMMCKNV